jgi:hypothetical protein
MASIQKQSLSTAPRHSFVVAMRAKQTTSKGPPWYEWIIVSRWGIAGMYLSIGRTGVSASRGKTVPINLAPSHTAMARLLRMPPAAGSQTFLSIRRKPANVSVPGNFSAAEGYVRLGGRDAATRLLAEGSCLVRASRSARRVKAVRMPWIGEFIEGAPVDGYVRVAPRKPVGV